MQNFNCMQNLMIPEHSKHNMFKKGETSHVKSQRESLREKCLMRHDLFKELVVLERWAITF